MMTTKLLTKKELAAVLSTSTRTIDRMRARGIDLGEVRLHDRATPRFDPAKVEAAIQAGKFPKQKRKGYAVPHAARTVFTNTNTEGAT